MQQIVVVANRLFDLEYSVFAHGEPVLMAFRVDCCADKFLKNVLKTKHLFTLDDASWEHLVACSACKYRLIRLQQSERNLSEKEFPLINGGVVLREIGSGGGGSVWLFLNQSDGLAFEAIKVLGQRSCDEEQTKMERSSLIFQAERERLARLDNGNAVVSYKRHGWTQNDHRPWISMTFLRGAPSSMFAQHFRLSLRQRIRLARDICRSVESIHRLGVIHCDLKPGNVIVICLSRSSEVDGNSISWTVRPVDFGCSYDWHETVDGERVRNYLSHVAGTPGYICPELLRACDNVGESMLVQATIDIYSLGIMLFELMTGCVPWSLNQYKELRHGLTDRNWTSIKIPSASETLAAAKRQTGDSKHQSVSAIPHGATLLAGSLDFIVAKATAADPRRRYQSAGELANQLNAWLRYRPIEGYTETLPVFLRRWAISNPVRTAIASAMLIFLVGISILVIANADFKALGPNELQSQLANSLPKSAPANTDVQEDL